MPIMQLYDKNTSTWQEVPALKGSAAKVEVGTVKTVPAAEQAKVTNVGTNTNAIFDFQLPRGMDGITPIRGTDYWTAADQQQIIKDVSDKMNYQFTDLMNAIQNKPVTYIFDDKASLDGALNLTNNTVTYNGKECKLNPGDVFLLVSANEPDYWFGEDSNGEKLHELDARKMELTEYVKSSQFQVMDIDAYNAIDTKDPNTFYFIVEKSDPTSSNEEATI